VSVLRPKERHRSHWRGYTPARADGGFANIAARPWGGHLTLCADWPNLCSIERITRAMPTLNDYRPPFWPLGRDRRRK
jgi:hypothetical protein